MNDTETPSSAPASTYLVRHGLMPRVARFASEPGRSFEAGDTVVVMSARGTEIGEVLGRTDAPAPVGSNRLRATRTEDLERADRAASDRSRRLAACEQIFRDGIWPLDLIDAEPLLEDRRTVLYYLGPHHLDASGLIAALRDACDLDVVLEPVGIDAPDEDVEELEAALHSCGSCGTGGGCGSGGGCSTDGGGCSGCAVKDLVRKPAVATS